MSTDNVVASPGVGGSTFRTFGDVGNLEWPASITCYIASGSAGAWVPQQVDATHGLPVSILGTPTVAVSGAVAVTGTFWQATQPVSGTVTATQGGAPWSTTISGTPTMSLGAATVPVSGTFWQTTQPVSGTVTANAGSGTMTVNPGNTANTTPWLTTVSTALPAGANSIGAVTAFQGGSPWGVTVATALPAGSATLGSVSIAGAGNTVSLGSSTVNVNIVAGGGSGGTASNFGSAFPATGTAIGVSDTAGNMGHLSVDGSGFLKVNVAAGSSGNGAASNTGSAVPTQADYTGLNVGGTLRGATGVNPSGSVYATQIDLSSVAGATVATGHGTASGAVRVELPTDGTGVVGISGTPTVSLGAATVPINVTEVGGNNVAFGSGTTTSGTIRVVLASDDTVSVAVGGPITGTVTATVMGTSTVTLTGALPAGSSTIGAVTAFQGGSPWGVSGTVALTATTTGGYTPFKFLPAAGTNTFTVKGSAGNLVLLDLSNGSPSPAFVHLFNTGNPTIGSGSASMAFFIPAGGGHVVPVTPPGISFNAGIGLTVTGGTLADSDTIAINGSNSICVTGAFL